MIKKITKCSMCQKPFLVGLLATATSKKHFEGMLGPIPVALHKKCFIKLNKYKILNLEDNK
jgi:hypothetical protein|tara:strand:- start:200 stop:382 length:183 start_codon:yes stop_codon:yes gene_type:complete